MKDKYTKERILLLHPKAISVFQSFINAVETELFITLRITNGFRSFEEQERFYNQPTDGIDNDKDGKIDEADECITKAKAGRSYHQYGLAIDIVPIINDKIDYSYDYSKIAKIAKRYNIVWGGDFVHFKDKPHFELSFGHSTKELLDLYYKGNLKNGYVQI